jgi:choline kinase
MTRHYIICAAGKGERFKTLLPGIAKPLIKLNSKTCLELSLSCLPILGGDSITIITQQSHGVTRQLSKAIEDYYPFNKINWLEVDSFTSGQLKTAVLAKEFVKVDEQIIIFNCDTYFKDSSLIQAMSDQSVDGIISCFEAPGVASS